LSLLCLTFGILTYASDHSEFDLMTINHSSLDAFNFSVLKATYYQFLAVCAISL
jgi:hypothetical protein